MEENRRKQAELQELADKEAQAKKDAEDEALKLNVTKNEFV